jgi:hypothetical protein
MSQTSLTFDGLGKPRLGMLVRCEVFADGIVSQFATSADGVRGMGKSALEGWR